jgi:hypothetical protein
MTSEEHKMWDIHAKIKKLMNLLDQITAKLHDLNIIKGKLLSNSTSPINYQILSEIEENEKTLNIPYISDLKQLNLRLSSEFESILKMRTFHEIQIAPENSALLLEGENILLRLENEITNQQKRLQEIIAHISPILTKIDPSFLESSDSPKKMLLKGQKFALFAFDVNNLYVSFKRKFENRNMLRKPPLLKRIRDFYLPKTQPFIAYFFASKHLESLQSFIPPNDFIHWEIEDKIKKIYPNGTFLYCDVDTRLAAVTYNIISDFHSQIDSFTLGSGDKDLKIVADLALKYNIPINVMVIDEHNLSAELRSIAKEIFELYS